jgi:hypothetical protein
MSQKNVAAPRLAAAPVEYEQRYFDDLLTILRLYFNQLDNPGPMAGATLRNAGALIPIISGLSFAEPDYTTPGAFVVSLPTEADLANLRVGDVYYDTTADNVLKVKV